MHRAWKGLINMAQIWVPHSVCLGNDRNDLKPIVNYETTHPVISRFKQCKLVNEGILNAAQVLSIDKDTYRLFSDQ